MRINSINNYYHQYNPQFKSVKNIQFQEEFNPRENLYHARILQEVVNSAPIKECCQKNDVNIKLDYVDIDKYESMKNSFVNLDGITETAKKNLNAMKGQHIYATSISIRDAKNPNKDYLYFTVDTENEEENFNRVKQKIANLKPDFYRQKDNSDRFITLPYITERLIKTLQSW